MSALGSQFRGNADLADRLSQAIEHRLIDGGCRLTRRQTQFVRDAIGSELSMPHTESAELPLCSSEPSHARLEAPIPEASWALISDLFAWGLIRDVQEWPQRD